MKKRLIIIPAYNEEKNLGKVIKEIRKYDRKSDIAVVDDGSIDKTGLMAEKLGVILLSHKNNLGYGAALQTGFKFGVKRKYSFMLQMDADYQHKASFIPRFFKEIEKGKYDVIIGSRLLEKSGYKYQL